jgi:hypothetical protein
MLVAIRTYQVFPFDFSAYQFDWERLARFVIVLSMVAIGIGIVVEAVKLVRSLVLPVPSPSTPERGENEKHRSERRTI